ncbi:MAG TPA: primosomal protein N' [Polyangiaceae bacterium]
MLLADIALPIPLGRALTYAVPAAHAARVVPGARVLVPLGARRVVGVVLDKREGEPPEKVRDVLRAPDEAPAVPAELLDLLRELASYYLAPIGDVLRLALPPLERELAKDLAQPTLFDEARGVGARKVQWVEAGEGSAPEKMSAAASALLARVRASGSVPLAKLAAQWPSARTIVKRLAEASALRVVDRAAPERAYFRDEAERDAPPELTQPQRDAVDAIVAALDAQAPKTFLLHGVTGSGKTEVYLHAIDRARAQGRGVVVLVPEIALTPQLVGRYRARFGDDVAVLHSHLTPKERHGMWHKLRSGKLTVAIGARSALFAPVASLGLVIVDEEHDSSFKQEEGVRYHARDMAILRAHRARGVCVLGSATPSLESEHLARSGRAEKLRLPARARAQAMPQVRTIDLRSTGPGPTGDKRISLPLHRALEETLARGEQAILFLNRRGFSPAVRCESCGKLESCPQCSVALTFHKARGGILRCHYCEHEAFLPAKCGACGAPALALEGLGTEKLEETLQTAFPAARIARLDRDVATGRAIEKILDRVRAREVDILVGTQMVTKGHDLPHVTLVGVVNADAALSLPDFRATERAFQLLVQVAGRAGRGDTAGRVLVQTYDPEHPAITYALRHDVDGFLEHELGDRRQLGYPPLSRVVLVRVDGADETRTRETTRVLADHARSIAERGVLVLGPAPAPLARLRGRWRFRIMMRSDDRAALRRAAIAVSRRAQQEGRAVRIGIDVDPVQLL